MPVPFGRLAGILLTLAIPLISACINSGPAATSTPTAVGAPKVQLTVAPRSMEGNIVYHNKVGIDYQIFTRELGSGKSVQLTKAGNNIEPAWSPDGKQIVYSCKTAEYYQLCIMNADGTGNKQITDRPFDHWGSDWSPDGKSIVLVTNDEKPSKISILDVASGSIRRVMKADGGESAPKWSPDGSRILYTANRRNFYDTQFIFSIKPDGTDDKAITDGGRDDRGSWSPDGKKIVFRREVEQSSMYSGVELMVSDADGKNAKRLTFNTWTDDWPVFSPDGKWILYTTDFENNQNLTIIPVEGGEPSPLASPAVIGRGPRWIK